LTTHFDIKPDKMSTKLMPFDNWLLIK